MPLFYTCSIKTQYMNEYFGVKFRAKKLSPKDARYYVTEDTQDTFTTLRNDLVEVIPLNEKSQIVVAKNFTPNGWVQYNNNYYAEVSKIIMRDNKQFFMPETEF